jgi:hypothetical protein
VEDRQARADRWIQGAHARIGIVEPEWWLRMVCGQLAEENSATQCAGMGRVVRRAAKQFRQRFGARTGSVGLEWLDALSRRNLPHEPAWWTRRPIP